jgi:hypothetical protein
MQIIIVEGSTTLSRIIKWLIRSAFTHCGLRYSGIESNWMVHAFIGGIQPDWWFAFSAKYKSILRYEVLFPEGDQALDNIIGRLAHAPYDYAGLIGHGISIIFRTKRNYFGSSKRYKCTELLTEWQNECSKSNKNLQLKTYNIYDTEMMAPHELVAYYESRPDLFRRIDDSL